MHIFFFLFSFFIFFEFIISSFSRHHHAVGRPETLRRSRHYLHSGKLNCLFDHSEFTLIWYCYTIEPGRIYYEALAVALPNHRYVNI